MYIIADENIDHLLIQNLQLEHTVLSIYHEKRGSSDYDIIRLAQQQPCIILTEDKDFGEYVFAHKIGDISIVLLRYHFSERESFHETVVKLLRTEGSKLIDKFTTITPTRLRIRTL